MAQFSEKVTKHKMCVLISYPLFLSDFKSNWILKRYVKNPQMWNLMKICLDEAELFLVDGHDKAKSPSPVLQTYLTVSRSRWPRGVRHSLQPSDCWDHRFESCWGHGRLSLMFAACCVAGSSVASRSPIPRSPIACAHVCLIVCDVETSTIRHSRIELECWATKKKKYNDDPH